MTLPTSNPYIFLLVTNNLPDESNETAVGVLVILQANKETLKTIWCCSNML